ncbi:MAG: 3-phosphoshikimate 1-carboxyvinyltransferase [Promethearchaeota archaeon]
MNAPEYIEIQPLERSFDRELHVPGSKSITNRALIIAALSSGETMLSNVLFSDDTRYMVDALRLLGIEMEVDESNCNIMVHGCGGRISTPGKPIFVGNSGTCMRFLSTLACLGKGEFIIDGNDRMRLRPMIDLIEGLRGLGATIESIPGNGCPPIRIQASGLVGGITSMDGATSSQYFSSILLSGPCAKNSITIKVQGSLVSRPYVDMTLSMMNRFGARASFIDDSTIHIHPSGPYDSGTYSIESDYSSASYFMAAAALTSSRIKLTHLPTNSLQGDSTFPRTLESMGAKISMRDDFVEVVGTGTLKAVDIDMFDYSDLVPTLAVVAMFAEGTTKISNVENIRMKETDRLAAISSEIKKLGGIVVEHQDGLEITGQPDDAYRGARVETYDDHRIAMAFSLVGLRVPGIEIADPGCTAKTYPSFFDDFSKLVG